jgi:mono/diheme cytochrome c family protein
MKTLRVLVIFLAILIAAVLGFIYSGLYDVAASSPDEGLIGWALETTQERSIHRRAEEIQPPPLDDPAMIRTGLIHYHEMCTVCHGAPGIKISETGQGLNPTPPELAGEAGHEEAGEMFWVVKNGIKMTGMPAFGTTHTDQEIWAIIAFLKRMAGLSPVEYQKMVQEAGLGEAEQAEPMMHEHAPGTPPHKD